MHPVPEKSHLLLQSAFPRGASNSKRLTAQLLNYSNQRVSSRALRSASLMAQDLEISQNDKRLYRYLTLPNGLHALLISDPETSIEETEHAKEGEHDEDEGSHASGSGSDLEASSQRMFGKTSVR